MTNKSELAVARFDEGFSCSQSVFSVYAEAMGVDRETALKIAGTFGGGLGRTGHTCGVVTGAIMALGLKYSTTDPNDKETKEQAYLRVQEFVKRFEGRNESINCKDLLGCDISTPEGLQIVREQNLYPTVCSKLVRDAMEILEDMLAE